MRTYLGKIASENGKPIFSASVREDAFDVTEELLNVALSDENKLLPVDDTFDAVAADVSAEPSFDLAISADAIDAVDKPKYVPSPTFAQKMLRADEILQDRYDELKNYALRFKKLKTRISKKFDSINQGRLHFVKLSVAGKTLKLYLNMDIADTDPKFHCKDMRDKKTYVTVPVLLRVKSGRAMRYAKILIDQCAAQHGLKENPKFQEVDAIGMVEQFLYGGADEEAAATEVEE